MIYFRAIRSSYLSLLSSVKNPIAKARGAAYWLAQRKFLTSGLGSLSSSGTSYKNVSGVSLARTSSGHAEADGSPGNCLRWYRNREGTFHPGLHLVAWNQARFGRSEQNGTPQGVIGVFNRYEGGAALPPHP